jgi:hypothetical protein
MSDMLQRPLQKSTSHSPLASAWGQSLRVNRGNRFNGFQKLRRSTSASMETVETVSSLQVRD